MSMITTKKPPEYLREARIRAGYVNRGTAAMVVPYSPETIGRHERGDIEMEPEDAVVYADCYNEPGIMARYCATCPVGQGVLFAKATDDITRYSFDNGDAVLCYLPVEDLET